MKQRFFILFMMFGITFGLCACNRDNGNSVSPEEENQENNNKTMNIKISGGREFTATMVENSSVAALLDMLKSGTLAIQMRDYGNMEKVGGLGKTLPTNDERITTEPGDLILYQGNALVIYYAANTWTFTRLGKINDVTQAELKAALGEGDVTVTLSLPNTGNTGVQAVNSADYQVYPNPASDNIYVSGEFEYLKQYKNGYLE
jgi:hypothetical protein